MAAVAVLLAALGTGRWLQGRDVPPSDPESRTQIADELHEAKRWVRRQRDLSMFVLDLRIAEPIVSRQVYQSVELTSGVAVQVLYAAALTAPTVDREVMLERQREALGELGLASLEHLVMSQPDDAPERVRDAIIEQEIIADPELQAAAVQAALARVQAVLDEDWEHRVDALEDQQAELRAWDARQDRLRGWSGALGVLLAVVFGVAFSRSAVRVELVEHGVRIDGVLFPSASLRSVRTYNGRLLLEPFDGTQVVVGPVRAPSRRELDGIVAFLGPRLPSGEEIVAERLARERVLAQDEELRGEIGDLEE